MNIPVIALVFLAALGVTLTRGARVAFVVVYLPTLILLNLVRPLPLPGVTDPTADVAAIYGILFGLMPHLGERLPFKLNVLDWVVFLMMVLRIITAMVTENYYTAVSTTSEVLVTVLAPYLLARSIVADAVSRDFALWVVAGCGLLLGMMAVIEARLWPYYFSRLMISAGLVDPFGELVYYRYGLFRARATFIHAIDFGNASVELLGILFFFAVTIRGAMRRISVQLALVALAGCAVLSISYTSLIALGAGLVILGFLQWQALRKHLVWLSIMGLIGGFAMTAFLLNLTVVVSETDTAEGSMMIRALIMQNGLPVALDAGLVGFGRTITKQQLQLESVDNSYLLSVIQFGWIYLALLLVIPVILCWTGSRAFRSPQGTARPLPLSVLIATTLGLMAGMFTVWFGFVYAIIFMILLGLTNSTIQLYRGTDQRPSPRPSPLAWRPPVQVEQLS